MESVKVATMTDERREGMLCLLEQLFGPRPNNPERCRRKMRNLYKKLPEKVTELIEKLLKLLKKYNFSLVSHENLLIICERFMPDCVSYLSADECVVSHFCNILQEWKQSGMDTGDCLVIQNNEEEFIFINSNKN
jgi:hypothetical protein